MITEFEGSAAYKFMEVAQCYYENDPDIRDKKRTVIAKDMENNAVLKRVQSLIMPQSSTIRPLSPKKKK